MFLGKSLQLQIVPRIVLCTLTLSKSTKSVMTSTTPSGVKRILLFGGSGMIGQGVLRECLNDPGVEQIVSVVRKPTEQSDPKLKQVVHEDFTNYDSMAEDMKTVDACFWCLGASSSAVNNEELTRVNKHFPLAAATLLAKQNPNSTFIYLSGQGTDPSSSTHWAKVKGETEEELMKLPFHAYNFRLGITRPMHGEQTKVRLHRIAMFFVKPFIPLVQSFSNQVSTTETVGRAMLHIARHGTDKHILNVPDINNVILPPK